MALGKYSRIENRRSSSSYCSTVTIVVFVALCLVGVWMMTSSSVGPVQNVDVQQENKDDVKQPVLENTGSNAQQFEDNPGDLPEDARKGDSSEDSSNQDGSNSSEQNNTEENQEGKPEEKTEEKPEETSEEKNKEETGRDEEPKSEKGSNSETEAESKTNTDETKDEKGESNSESGESKTESEESESGGQNESENSSEEKKADASEEEEKSEESEKKSENSDEEKDNSQIDEKVEQNNDSKSDETTVDNNENSQNQTSTEVFPSGAQSELSTENSSQSGAWSTQASESKNEKEAQKSSKQQTEYNWKLCNVTAGTDYIPCLDNLLAIKSLPSSKHYEHRERHCPEEPPTCLVPLPEGYKRSIAWPKSRDKIWYYNVPHTKLAEVKGHQNWVKVSGEFLTFPGGGTQFKHGALHYIDFIQESVPDVAWGKQTRVILDVGCGVASFGGYLFERDVLAMSFAPKDEHEAQVQFAVERGIPAVSAVMGTTRLPYPGRVFDAVHCARCRVPWHIEGGKLLLELNRVLRPGGFFVWSATPVYQKLPEDVEIWNAMGELTKAMCWELISINKDTVNGVGVALYKKPTNNECYEKRQKQEPLICPDSDDINAAWNVPLQACMHKIPVGASECGSQWPEQWPLRLEKPPYWLLSSRVGVYGKAAPEDFTSDYEHWKHVVINSYVNEMGVDWKSIRNVMDMRSIYGGFAAALKNLNVWVMNVVSIDAPDTLPIIYDRGLFGIYHDWCESFSTYPRSYDLLHADHLFSKVKKSRCNLVAVVAECDRILRPEGKLIIRDDAETISELENMAKSMKWEVRFSYLKDNEGLLYVQKSIWRPTESETLKYAIL